jgi:hypothetical protein
MKAYHLHTPKSGGTFLKTKLIDPLQTYCGLQFVNQSAHEAWSLVADDVYVISSFREPVKRIVSHYCHFNEVNEEEIITVATFVEWYNSNKTYLKNYQSKNFLIIKDFSNHRPALRSEQVFIDVQINETELYKNIKRTNVLIRDNQFNDEKLEQIKLNIISDLNLSNNFYVKDVQNFYNSRQTSHKLYAELPETIKKQIRQDNALDYELYLNNSLYWNNGQ